MKYGEYASTLLGSLNSGDSSINYADYAAIKNGSYGKLMKAYYSELGETDQTSSSKKTRASDLVKTDNTALAKVKTASDTLKKSATALTDTELWKTTNGSPDMEQITKSVEAFAEDYNSVITQSKKSDSSNVKDAAGWMTSLTGVMKDSLSKVGISIGTDKTLSVNTETLKTADIKTLKTLFSGSSSYAGQIAQKANSISSAALNSAGLYNSDGSVTSTISGLFGGYA